MKELAAVWFPDGTAGAVLLAVAITAIWDVVVESSNDARLTFRATEGPA
jgi:hypothetical protein